MNTVNTYENTPKNTGNTNKHLCFENSLEGFKN